MITDEERGEGLARTTDASISSRLELGFATEPEIGAVTGDVDSVGDPKGRIHDWRFLAVRDPVARQVTLHVFGRLQTSRSLLTSSVAVVTPDRSRVRTRNSLYELGAAAEGEPDPMLLPSIAAALGWGS
jgi:hypothetical protein